MKIGLCVKMTVENGVVEIEDLDLLKKLGFDYYEIPFQLLGKCSEEEFEKICAYIEKEQINVYSANLFAPADMKLTGPLKDEAQITAFCHKAAKRAQQLGMQAVVLGSGGARNRPSGYPLDAAMLELKASIALCAELLEQYGILMVVEHLNRQDSNMVNRFYESCEIVRGCDNAKSILDTFHFEIGNEDIALIEQNKDVLGHIHFARTVGRAMPKYEDLCELQNMLQVIKATGYDDLLSFECKYEDLERNQESYRKVVSYFKEYFAILNLQV